MLAAINCANANVKYSSGSPADPTLLGLRATLAAKPQHLHCVYCSIAHTIHKARTHNIQSEAKGP